MNTLLLSCRDLLGQVTGRKQVLWTAIESLSALGHNVSVAHFGHHSDIDLVRLRSLNVISLHQLLRPSYWDIAWNCARVWKEGYSFNEAIFYSARNLKTLKEIVDKQAIDFVVCDMLRMAPYASQLGLPWHLDMDDQLSQRYFNLLYSSEPSEQLVGYYGQMLPTWARRFASLAARCILPIEAGLMRKREGYWAKQASSVSLVSQIDADSLAARTGLPVACLPMRATFLPPSSSTRDHDSQPSSRVVFLGGLDYQPNLDALRYYRDQVLPCLMGPVTCEVIGSVPSVARREFTTPAIRLHGYVADLSAHLSRYSVFVAPITNGTGIKTKVLDAMAHGLAVVATPKAVEGLSVTDHEHCLICDTPESFAAAIEKLLGNPSLAASLGNNAYRLVKGAYSLEVICRRWEEMLDQIELQHFQANLDLPEEVVEPSDSNRSHSDLQPFTIID